MLLGALHQALDRVKTPEFPSVTSTPPTPTPASPPAAVSTATLEDAIAEFVAAWAREKTVGCQFDVLWNHLKERHPQLTIGAFQDALRALHNASRIRLSGWPRMLDDMPQPNLALFISSKVMYYAQPAQPHG
jgi:non-ribosomal peptide synthetase component F